MSGGAFDYDCFRISSFAEDLKNKLDEKELNLSEEVEGLMIKIQALIELAGKAAKEVEWLYSGDTGEETFIGRMETIFQESKRCQKQ